MGHVPHLLLARPWLDDRIPLDAEHRHHLERVLRRASGDPVGYTDGAGTLGEGVLSDGAVRRRDERMLSPPPPLTLAVAPPAAKERTRFLVEKLAELGVAHLRWLDTRRGEGRPPRPDKAAAWSRAGLEQSRGAWLTEVDPEPVDLTRLGPSLLVADPGGGPLEPLDGPTVVAVGPEGGWEPTELPPHARRVRLGERVLRVETAAIVVAARLLR